jgi:hypothetical protein
MKKFTSILFMLSLLVLLAAGNMVPNQAFATNDDVPQMQSGEGGFCEDLIMEQCGGSNDGASGDPDAAGDGLGFMGDSFGGPLSDLLENGEITMEEFICILMEQFIFAQ